MTPVHMERAESAIRTVLAFTEAFNRLDFTRMLGLIDDECVVEAPSPAPDGAVYKGKSAIAQYWQDYISLRPGVHINIEETFGYGSRCVVFWRLDWEDAAGQPVHQRGLDIYHVQNNLVTEKLSYIKA